MSIELNFDDDELKNYSSMYVYKDVEHVNARQDGEAVRKTNTVAPSVIATTFRDSLPDSLVGRVEFEEKVQVKPDPVIDANSLSSPEEELELSESLPDLFEEKVNIEEKVQVEPGPASETDPVSSLEEQLQAMDPEDLRAIDRELGKLKQNPPSANFYLKLQQVVELMLNMHVRLGEKERIQKDGEKRKFNQSNQEWGKLQRETGDRGLNFTWIALGLMLIPVILPGANQTDKEFANFFAREGCTNIANMFNSDTQSKQQMVRAVSELAMAEINAMMNKGSSDSSSKEQVIGILEKASQSYTQAARAG